MHLQSKLQKYVFTIAVLTTIYCEATEPPPTKVEGFSGLERLRRTVGAFPTEVGGFKPDFWKMKK